MARNIYRGLDKGIETEEGLIRSYKDYIKKEDYESAKAIHDVFRLFDLDVKNLT